MPLFQVRSKLCWAGSKLTSWSMIWIQSIICSLLFLVNFAWHPKHWAVAVALNILLASSCLGLLLTSSRREIGNRPGEKPESKSGDIGRNVIVTSLVLLFFVASVLKLNGSSTALWRGPAGTRDPRPGGVAGTATNPPSKAWAGATPP